jgi:hypothetical protein
MRNCDDVAESWLACLRCYIAAHTARTVANVGCQEDLSIELGNSPYNSVARYQRMT